MEEDLKRIKKKYGENMSHLCRKLFPIILEEKGLLPKMMEQYFEPSKELYKRRESSRIFVYYISSK